MATRWADPAFQVSVLPDRLLGPEDLLQLFGADEPTLSEWLRTGRLPRPTEVEGRPRWTPGDVECLSRSLSQGQHLADELGCRSGNPATVATSAGPRSNGAAAESTIAAQWAGHAEALADWAMSRVVVRHDVYGAYKLDGGQFTAHAPLNRDILVRHYRGEPGGVIGLHSTSPDNLCKCVAWDIDAHDDQADPETNWRYALKIAEGCRKIGLKPLIFDSNGRGGYHVRVFFKKPIPAAVAYWFGQQLVVDHAEHGFVTPPETFPKQPGVSIATPFGNWLRAPGGRHHKRDHWARNYDPEKEKWFEGGHAAQLLVRVAGDKADQVLAAYRAEEQPLAKVESKVEEREGIRSRDGSKVTATGGKRAKQHDKPTDALVRDALRHLPAEWADSYGAQRNNPAWLGVGMALHSWDQSAGLALWDEFSRRCPEKYDPDKCREKWDTFNSGGALTVGTIFHEAMERGWVPPWKAGADGPPAGPKDDDDSPIVVRPWPTPPDGSAYIGLAGEIVRAIEPHTEADPLGLLAQLLVMFGSAGGRGPRVVVEDTAHHANENVVLVGESSLARKGTSAERIRSLLRGVNPDWDRHHVKAGLSSGEGLITAVSKMGDDGGEIAVAEGVSDKSLLVLETEFGSVLRALEREGNKLSSMIREAWDHGNLATLTKNPLTEKNAHISIIGHITADELLALLSKIDAANGFANRFLWLAVRRSKVLPFGGGGVEGRAALEAKLKAAIAFAPKVGAMGLERAAREVWADNYARLTTPPPGVLGKVTSRAAPHVLRLAMLYALMDCQPTIPADHLRAALALWDASARCAAYIFGDALGDPVAEKILAAIRDAAPAGLARNQIREDVLHRNTTAPRIKQALALLLGHALIREERDAATGGAPALRYYAVDAVNAESPPPPPPYRVNRVNRVPPSPSAGAPTGGRERGQV